MTKGIYMCLQCLQHVSIDCRHILLCSVLAMDMFARRCFLDQAKQAGQPEPKTFQRLLAAFFLCCCHLDQALAACLLPLDVPLSNLLGRVSLLLLLDSTHKMRGSNLKTPIRCSTGGAGILCWH